jgi:hypothetical protein
MLPKGIRPPAEPQQTKLRTPKREVLSSDSEGGQVEEEGEAVKDEVMTGTEEAEGKEEMMEEEEQEVEETPKKAEKKETAGMCFKHTGNVSY